MVDANAPTPPAPPVPTPTDDYDSPWKEVAARFFPQLVEFFAPDLYDVIDWSAGYEFLEQELREMLRDAETGSRRVDKVVKVHTVNGKPLYFVLHVEIQVTRESGFPQRIFVYYYRLYDIHPEQVVSLAILADEKPGWEPDTYEHELYGTRVELRYRTVKLWEYNSRWAELEKDPNPFALVVRAHLKTQATRGDAEERLAWKVRLVRELYEWGQDPQEIFDLFRFIDWLLILPDDMTQSFRERTQDIKQESKMKYVTSIERLERKEGREEGQKEGRKEGLQKVVLTQLEAKFGPLDDSTLQRIKKGSQEQILLWAKRILTASSPDEIFAT
jgi:hypothetical protein